MLQCSGIGVGILFGEQIAIKASEENSKEIEIIEARNKPTWLPPQPFLNLGVKTRLVYERLRARTEIWYDLYLKFMIINNYQNIC